jgi:phosphoserine phosphatase
MKSYTIIWDFDGTILPSEPYDSEQALLFYKVNREGGKIPFFKRLVARAIIYADMKEWLGESFKKYYLWVLRGTPIEILDRVAEDLAIKISEADRQTFLRLEGDGHDMMIISCGTLELIERILNLAGIGGCFKMISGNRFKLEKDQIAGMDFDILSPMDKIKEMNARGILPEQSIVIGDGYTDLPLLDWAGVPVLIDRTGEKREKYATKDYNFISSIPEIVDIINPDISETDVATDLT